MQNGGIYMGLFSNYFQGKPGQGDFSSNKLPATRVELFFQVMKDHWAQLIGLNMLYFLAFLPLVAWLLIHFLMLMDQLSKEAPAWSEFMAQMQLLFLGAAPLIAITGPITAGVSYVMRNWARDEHAFLFSDMSAAIKENWKQAFVVSIVTGLLPLCTFMAFSIYGTMATTRSVVMIIPLCLVCIGQILWLLMLEPVYTLMVTYDLRLRDLLKNALFLALTNLPRSLGIRLVTMAGLILAILAITLNIELLVYALFAVFAYYLFFGLSITRLVYASYGNMLSERYLNPNIEGAQTNIGLRPEDDTVYRQEDEQE